MTASRVRYSRTIRYVLYRNRNIPLPLHELVLNNRLLIQKFYEFKLARRYGYNINISRANIIYTRRNYYTF